LTQILLDSNLLLLWVVGNADTNFIRSNKRLKAFDERAYHLLCGEIEHASVLVVTPHILAEVSNLLDLKATPQKTPLAAQFKRMVLATTTLEIYQRSKELVNSRVFQRLGLSDCAISALDADIKVLTCDLDLYLYLCEIGRQERAINFSSLRDANY